MTNPFQPTRYDFEYPDEAGYPDGSSTPAQYQTMLIDQVLDNNVKPDLDFTIITAYIDNHREYEDLVDATRPGIKSGGHR